MIAEEWPYEETHEGLHPAFGYLTTHRGAQSTCSSPDCVSLQPVAVPEGWGSYCPHGEHIVVHDPAHTDEDGYPLGVVVEPWPCGECTREEFEAAEEQAYADSLPSYEEIYGLY